LAVKKGHYGPEIASDTEVDQNGTKQRTLKIE
jgi:hypothetical protein